MKRDSKIRKTALILSAVMVFEALWTSSAGTLSSYAANGPGENGIPEGISEEAYAALSDGSIEWSEIEDIVRYKNPTYGIYTDQVDDSLNDMTSAARYDISEYKDQIDDIDDVINEIRDAQQKLAGAGAEGSEAWKKLEESLNQSIAGRTQLKAALADMGGTLRTLRYSDKNADLSLGPLRDQLISAIESLIISYKTLEINAEMLKEQVSLYETLYESGQAMQEQGLATAQDTASYKNQLEQARTTLSTVESSLARIRDNILIQCGYEPGAEVTIADLPDADRHFLEGRDREADKKTAIEANSTVQASWSVSSYSGDVLKYRDINANAMEGKAASAFGNIAAELEEQVLLTEASDTSLQKAELINRSADLKYSLGMLSKSEYETQKLQYISARATAEINELNLHQAIENYRFAVRGLMQVQ